MVCSGKLGAVFQQLFYMDLIGVSQESNYPKKPFSGDDMESLFALTLGRGLVPYRFYTMFTHSNMASMFHLADIPCY